MGVFNCLEPRFIYNSRGELKKVRCGHCAACRNTKSLNYATLCKLESQSHKYCAFVTLTYDRHNLPLVNAVERNGYYYFFPSSHRFYEHYRLKMLRGDKLFPFVSVAGLSDFNSCVHKLYTSKFNLPEKDKGKLPVLDKVDLQQFLKRLRYYLKKYTNEKIRYFAVGEYGPVHFRPHYHLLLWFDQPETLQYMGKSVYSSWKFGRCDCSLSKGKTASYVASYTNSTSAVSRLHALKGIRTFVLHSSHLFGSFYKDEEEKVYELEYERLANKGYTDNGRYKQVPPVLAFESSFFPRCLNYDKISHYDRLVCYRLLSTAIDEYGQKPITALAQDIYNDVDGKCHLLLETIAYDGKFKLNTILSVLYTSKKFYKHCHEYNMTPHSLVLAIERYWRDKDYYNLKKQLQLQEELTLTLDKSQLPILLYFYDDFYLQINKPYDENQTPDYPKPILDYINSLGFEPLFINDYFFDIQQNPLYVDFSALHNKIANDLIKHKKLNDLNKIFNY